MKELSLWKHRRCIWYWMIRNINGVNEFSGPSESIRSRIDSWVSALNKLIVNPPGMQSDWPNPG
jgi:predicted chitinase